MNHPSLPDGIIGVLQTPFTRNGTIDWNSLERLIEDALDSGIDGFLLPAVASEVVHLSPLEREELCRFAARVVNGRSALILGASAETIAESKRYAALAEQLAYHAYLLPVHQTFYQTPEYLLPYLQMITPFTALPFILQDLDWQRYGLPIEFITAAKDNLPTFCGIKVETVPAGPKYTRIRQTLGHDFYICGGWAVPQMIEALDRGVNGLMPECSMIRVYKTIWNLYRSGKRVQAIQLFERLLPILAFSNQEIQTSIAFFKRLLVRRGIFQTEYMRIPTSIWDVYNTRIADELIERYLEIETGCIAGVQTEPA